MSGHNLKRRKKNDRGKIMNPKPKYETMITLRVTKLEREHLKNLAKKAGYKTVSEYIRAKVGL